ncbi:MAG: IS200/IS605 family transposase [Candidatus Hydrogenedens sp.]|nr:IS200/IS605 family transposase [Candidatus Hydrogenedens sp.]
MSSTHTCLLYHVVFATKERRPWLDATIRPRVHGYLNSMVQQNNAIALAVGGVEDHVHLLLHLHQSHALASFVRDLKAGSSRWIHESLGLPLFGWQAGYGAFTVSASQKDRVARYIENQAEHHAKHSFRQELEALLHAHGIEYDPQYLD